MIVNKRVAVVTGAASGIGLALVKACILDGMHVVMADIAQAALHEQVEQLKASSQAKILGVVCDVAKLDDVEQLAKQAYERFGQVDILINNAGVSGQLAPFWELTNQSVRQVLEVNLYGVVHGVQTFLPLMFNQKHRSQIVNMASFYGLCSGSQMAAYAMSKHAIVALSESLYFDLKRLNKPVDVSVVCPSFANTQLLANSAPSSSDTLHNMVGGLIERSRPAEDIAACIMREVKNNTFYILPDKEVKDYCEQRTNAIINQSAPHEHSIEKIIASLSKRALGRADKS
jgi:NAD(P)-dependent dehydrogenase (short-subunit alcohol dehydrogenase family)